MKKFIIMLLVLTLCLTMVCPALATEGDFVPSITYKPFPSLTGPVDEIGMQVGKLKSDGEIVAKLYLRDGKLVVIGEGIHDEGDLPEDHECLIITPLSEAETSTEIPSEAKELLLWIYEQILALGMSFFADCEGLNAHIAANLGEGKTAEDMIVKDLFDVSVICEPLEEWLEPAGTTLCLDFEVGVAPGTFVSVVAYKGGKWKMIEDVEVQEDGTVTCNTFENFCPVAILVSNTEIVETAAVEEVNTGDNSQLGLWITLAAASLAAVVVLAATMRKSKKAQ